MKAYLLEDTNRIFKVLESYNFHDIWYASQDEIRCATPEGSNRTSVSILLKDELYASCYSDNFNGDIYGLIQHFDDSSFIDVLKDINNMFGFSVGARTKNNSVDLLKDIRKFKKREQREFENRKFDKSILNQYIHKQHASMIQEGISPKVLEMFNVCFDVRSSRIIMPHFDDAGESVVGIKGRHTESAEMCKMLDIQKYMNIIVGYRMSNNLYGWHLAKENVNESKYLILFEAEKSVMKHTTFNFGVCCSVALGGHNLSDYHVKKIIQGTDEDVEIIIAMDTDIPEFTTYRDNGKTEEIGVVEMAKRFSKYRKVSYIYDQYKILGEKASPVDKGFKKYDFLWRHRRQVC